MSYSQTSARSEVRKHQEWNQRCPPPQVTIATCIAYMLTCKVVIVCHLSFLTEAQSLQSLLTGHVTCSLQVVRQYELAQAACGSARTPHRPTHTQGKSNQQIQLRAPSTVRKSVNAVCGANSVCNFTDVHNISL